MAKQPTTPTTEHGDNEKAGTQAGDSQSPNEQHQQGVGNKPHPIIEDWASI